MIRTLSLAMPSTVNSLLSSNLPSNGLAPSSPPLAPVELPARMDQPLESKSLEGQVVWYLPSNLAQWILGPTEVSECPEDEL